MWKMCLIALTGLILVGCGNKSGSLSQAELPDTNLTVPSGSTAFSSNTDTQTQNTAPAQGMVVFNAAPSVLIRGNPESQQNTNMASAPGA